MLFKDLEIQIENTISAMIQPAAHISTP